MAVMRWSFVCCWIKGQISMRKGIAWQHTGSRCHASLGWFGDALECLGTQPGLGVQGFWMSASAHVLHLPTNSVQVCQMEPILDFRDQSEGLSLYRY